MNLGKKHPHVTPCRWLPSPGVALLVNVLLDGKRALGSGVLITVSAPLVLLCCRGVHACTPRLAPCCPRTSASPRGTRTAPPGLRAGGECRENPCPQRQPCTSGPGVGGKAQPPPASVGVTDVYPTLPRLSSSGAPLCCHSAPVSLSCSLLGIFWGHLPNKAPPK